MSGGVGGNWGKEALTVEDQDSRDPPSRPSFSLMTPPQADGSLWRSEDIAELTPSNVANRRTSEAVQPEPVGRHDLDETDRRTVEDAAQKSIMRSHSQRQADVVQSPAPSPRLWALAILGAAFAIIAAAGMATWRAVESQPVTRTTGVLVFPPDRPDLIVLAANQASIDARIRLLPSEKDGLLRLSCQVEGDDEEVRHTLDQLGTTIAEHLNEQFQLATRPDQANMRLAELADEVETLARDLPTQSAAAPSPRVENAVRLPQHRRERWKELLEARGVIENTINKAKRALQTPEPQPADVRITDEVLADALVEDTRFNADLQVLQHRVEELRQLLGSLLQTAVIKSGNGEQEQEDLFSRLAERIDSGRADLSKSLESSTGERTRTEIEGLVDAINDLDRVGEQFKKVWHSMVERIDGGPMAPSAVLELQSDLTEAAKGFLEQSEATDRVVSDTLRRISQGRGEVTRRVVLQNTLHRQLKPVRQAAKAVQEFARRVIPESNPQLTANLQRAEALHIRTTQKKETIRHQLREKQLDQLQVSHAGLVRQTERELQTLSEDLAAVDQEIRDNAESAWLAADEASKTNREVQQSMARLQENLLDLANAIRSEHEADVAAVEQTEPTQPIRYVPATTNLVPNRSETLWPSAMAFGAIPLVIYLATVLLIWFVVSTRVSARSIDAAARSLQTTAVRDTYDSGRFEEG